VRTLTGVIPNCERVVGLVMLTPFSLRALPHNRMADRPQGELTTSLSYDTMHIVPCGILLHDAREGWALSQGGGLDDVGVRVREQSTPSRAQQPSHEPYPVADSAFCRRDCMIGMHSACAMARSMRWKKCRAPFKTASVLDRDGRRRIEAGKGTPGP
jgi:hypothetical protein